MEFGFYSDAHRFQQVFGTSRPYTRDDNIARSVACAIVVKFEEINLKFKKVRKVQDV